MHDLSSHSFDRHGDPFMMNVHDEDARRRLFTAYHRRGGDENLRILDRIVELRAEMAGLYDLPTYAHYENRTKAAQHHCHCHRPSTND